MSGRLAQYYHAHRRRLRRIAIWTAAVVTLWAVVMGLILPPILRHVAEKQLSQVLGSNCTLAKLRFNPFTLRLTAEQLRIPLPDGADCFSLARFEVRFSPAGIYRFAPVLSDLKLVAPRVDLVLREDGSLSVAELQPAAKQPAAQAEPAAAGEKGGVPFGLVVTDLEIRGGELVFHDRIRQADHKVTDLGLFVPFTSTLNRHRERSITPYLEAVVNGRPLRVDGRLAPFAEQLHTEFDIRLDHLDLARFQPYVAPFTTASVSSGQLSTELVFSMRQQPASGLRLGLSGRVTLVDLAVLSPQQDDALRLPRLIVDLDGALNTDEGMTFRNIEIQKPEAHLALLADGRLDWSTWLRESAGEAPAEPAAEAPSVPLQLHVARLVLRDGHVTWQDRKVKGGFQANLAPVALTVTDLHLPAAQSARVSAEVTMNSKARLELSGDFMLQPVQGDFQVRLADLPLSEFQAYLTASGVPVRLASGGLSFDVRLEAAAGEAGPQLTLKDGTLNLKDLALRRDRDGQEFFGLAQLSLAALSVDLDGRRVEAGQLLLGQPALALRRDRHGVVDLLQLSPPTPNGKQRRRGAAPDRPWTIRLAEVKLQDGRIAASLEGPGETTQAVVQALACTLTDFDSAAKKPFKVALNGREKQGGALSVDGTLALSPLNANLRVRTDRLNLKPFSPLLGQVAPSLRLGAGTLSTDLRTGLRSGAGKLRARVRGQVTLASLSLLDGKQEFAALRTLRIRQLDIDTARRRYHTGDLTLVRPQVSMIVDAGGQNNFGRLFGSRRDASAGPAVAEPEAKAAEPSYLGVGAVEISEGMLLMRDESYSPAVSNRLEKLALHVDPFDNAADSRARLSFSGVLDGAAVSGEGEMTPLREDMVATLQAQLQALDLTRLSPMSERFIAYPLRKGTFTLDSTISIDQGRLDSTHRIELDALELGDKVEAPGAPDLPVKLGISLLQDPAGNIDLTLPVRGDLSDPSFSVGGLVLKVITNLLVKAVASPFVLLGNLLGGAEQGLEFIAFEPGEGRLLARDADAVSTLAEMLAARPKIDLVLIPQADEADRGSLADAYALRRMQEMKYADLSERERAASRPQDLQIGPGVDADEYEDLLFAVYKEQPFDKPRNLIGMTRKLPPQEMMEAIRAHYPSDDSALEQLALERAANLRQALISLHPELADRINVDPPRVPGEGGRVTFGIK